METKKNIIDAVTETQTKTLNNLVESTQKMQKAILGGQAIDKSSDLYKEWLNNQMNIFTTSTNTIKDTVVEQTQNTVDTQQNNSTEFFKNWYNSQMGSIKQLVDFNQNLYNSTLNYGKPTDEITANFKTMNTSFDSVYSNWMNTLNTSFENLSKTMGTGVGADTFKTLFNTNNAYNKMQDVFTPWVNAAQTGNFNADTFKKLMDPNQFKTITENLFKPFFTTNNTKDIFEAYTKQLDGFFGNQTTTTKEFMQNAQNFYTQLPTMFSGKTSNMTDLYSHFTTMMEGTFGPVLKMMPENKEKEMATSTIEILDKAAHYAIKQAQMQFVLYTTMQNATEKTAEWIGNRVKNATTTTEATTVQTIYTEWTSLVETTFLELFNGEEYATLKGEMLAVGLGLKKDLEKQMEWSLGNTPVVLKSEMEEVYKTIYDLKKQVKELQGRLAIQNAQTIIEGEETKEIKSRKK